MNSADCSKESAKYQGDPTTNAWRERIPYASLDLKISLDTEEKKFPLHGCVWRQNEDPNRTRITVAGSRIYYPGNIVMPTGSLDLAKLIINSFMSRHNACFFCFDTKTNYLQTPMDRPEYVRIKLLDIPQ